LPSLGSIRRASLPPQQKLVVDVSQSSPSGSLTGGTKGPLPPTPGSLTGNTMATLSPTPWH